MAREGGNPVRKTSLVSFDTIYEIVVAFEHLEILLKWDKMEFQPRFLLHYNHKFHRNFVRIN